MIESEYGGVYSRREVDARLHCEIFDYLVVQHEAVRVLAVTRLRMFPYMGWACGCFDFLFSG